MITLIALLSLAVNFAIAYYYLYKEYDLPVIYPVVNRHGLVVVMKTPSCQSRTNLIPYKKNRLYVFTQTINY